MKVKRNYTNVFGEELTAKIKATDTDDMTAQDFMAMCLELYEKSGWVNEVSVVVHNSWRGDTLFYCNPKE